MSRQKIFKLDIITPAGTLFSDNVLHVVAPGVNGRFGVLVNHISSVFLLQKGRVDIQAIQGDRHFAIADGVAEVKMNKMKIITRAAKDITNIDAT
ncbi:hypothetical protein EH223_12050 [candidate division KSB1 bacterium]|nr:F0F1 ATP synthase subunit epsilon [candidate division KSB1 bacterium]RQW02559.1 MAG: hypothetical protein EH223_12050 [candidate division KSB1 bacterium]